MSARHEIEDQDGRRVATVHSGHKYLLPDGSKCHVDEKPAWCFRCCRFVMVEGLTDPDMLREEAIEFSRTLPCEEHRTEYLQHAFRHAEQLRSVLRNRRSPARCLGCGGIDFVRLSDDGTWTTHPNDPTRRIRMRPLITALDVTSPLYLLYDTEGNRISRPS